ncbi:MAG: serine/threonine-protein kinase [Nannocystaceae bacterium]
MGKEDATEPTLVASDRLPIPAAPTPRRPRGPLAEVTDAAAPTISGDDSEEAPEGARLAARLGHFALLRKLGEGGMGSVYAAYDEDLDRRVAIKILHATGARTRLLREAQALARLSHPNVIQVYAVDVADAQIYIAMEYVAGQNLKEWVDGEPRPWQSIVATFIQAGRGLEAAHSVGLIHRDFKPENVLVGDDGRVRVADFGLAARRHEIEDLTSGPPLAFEGDLTRTGALMGTPAYMSPEQLQGAPLTAASDLFSFCVALYCCLFGAHPFAGDTFLTRSASVIAGAVRPPPPSAVPATLSSALIRGLAVQPGDRPTIRELLRELERHVGDDPSLELTHGRRARLLAVTAITGLAAAADFWVLGRGDAPPEALTFRAFLMSLGFLAGALALLGAVRRRRAALKVTKTLARMIALAALALVTHRGLSTIAGVPVGHVLLGDLLLLALLFVAMGLLIAPWLHVYGAIAATAAVILAFTPSHAPLLMAGAMLSMLIFTVALRARSRDPERVLLRTVATTSEPADAWGPELAKGARPRP